jgi:hypothetical protein
VTPPRLTHEEIVAAAYAQGVKDAAERAALFVVGLYGDEKMKECDEFVLRLIPASRDEMINRGVPL